MLSNSKYTKGSVVSAPVVEHVFLSERICGRERLWKMRCQSSLYGHPVDLSVFMDNAACQIVQCRMGTIFTYRITVRLRGLTRGNPRGPSVFNVNECHVDAEASQRAVSQESDPVATRSSICCGSEHKLESAPGMSLAAHFNS